MVLAPRVNRRAFHKTGGAVGAWLATAPGWSAPISVLAPTDDEILAEAKKRIEKNRLAPGVITVRSAAGKPVPGAKVTVEQLSHAFRFGCNFFLFGQCGDAAAEEAYRQKFGALFNYCTLGFYWASYEPERGHPNYAYTDQVVEWTRQHGISAKGHPLAWDHPASSPAWLPNDLKEIEQLSKTRVHEIVERYRGRINIWDVVNEPTHLADKVNKTKMADMADRLGAVEYVAEHLRVARGANPQATLLVNDYRTDTPYLDILQSEQETGKYRFDVVGIQSHMHDGVWPLEKVWRICDTYARLGLPLHFTETPIVSGPRGASGQGWGTTTPEGEAAQAEKTVRFYTALFGHPAVQAITWWDFTDRGAWQGAPAGWVRQDMSPKPVYERMLGLVKKDWWTRAELRTDAKGEAVQKAFKGKYQITAQIPGAAPIRQEVQWGDGPNEFVLEPRKGI